jgi:hypothetical protein
MSDDRIDSYLVLPRLTKRRALLTGGAALAATAIASSGCGYLLYPERRGRTGGRVDVLVMVVDLLWLIPGLIPGVICLVVDFTTGCIYEHGERHSSAPRAGDPRITSTVEIDGEVVATGDVEPGRPIELRWRRAVGREALRAHGRLGMQTAEGALAEAYVRDLI